MNDKTFKIRIKLRSTGTPVESLSADPDELELKATAPPTTARGEPNRLPLLGGFISLAVILLVSIYMFTRQESADTEESAYIVNHEPLESVQIVNESSSESMYQNPAVNQDSMALESRDSEDLPSTFKLADSSDSESGPPPQQAESHSFDISSENTSENTGTISKLSEAMTEASEPSATPSQYAKFESSHQNNNAAEDLPPDEYSAITSESEDNAATHTTKATRSERESVASADAHSESIHIESPALSHSQVTRAQFTSGIEAREPIDRVDKTFYSDGKKLKRLYFFTEIRDMKGDSVVHRWSHQGNTVANITFNINGDRWRVYSSKNLPSSMKGPWNVVVTDSGGKLLVSKSFIYD